MKRSRHNYWALFLSSFKRYDVWPERLSLLGPLVFIWYMPARLIRDYQIAKCENYFPDYKNLDGSIGTKVRLVFGYFLDVPEGSAVEWRWWRYFRKVRSSLF